MLRHAFFPAIALTVAFVLAATACRTLNPDALRDEQTGIPIPPRQQVDDAHRVDGLQNARIRCGAGGPRDQIDGRDRWIVVVLVDLAVADEDGRSGVDGHR